MKFRAVLQDQQFMREFQNIVLTLSKLCKECVLTITKDKVYFIANEEPGTAAPLVWVEIDAKLYFPEYTVQGVSDTHPNILLTVVTSHLGRALTTLRQNARYCKIKLTNIQFPCLTVEAEVVPQSSDRVRKVTHDVPVTIIPRSDWDYYSLPDKPTTNLVLNIPSNRLMRSLIDRIKNLSPTITFHATSKCEMNLVAETSMATITTRYRNLEIRAINPSEADNLKEYVEASCLVDCKKAALFFGALQVPTLELSCGIDHDHLIHLEVNVREGVAIHSVLPAVCM